VEFKILRDAVDKTLTEFKLARSSRLKQNLEMQAEIYQKGSDAEQAIKVILYYTEAELRKVQRICKNWASSAILMSYLLMLAGTISHPIRRRKLTQRGRLIFTS
jgi:hypothetical protein